MFVVVKWEMISWKRVEGLKIVTMLVLFAGVVA
jgi:hypothetical protein